MLIDCHNHTNVSPDGDNTSAEMLEAAVKAGIEVFAITDHCEIDCFEKHDVENGFARGSKEIEKLKEKSEIKLLFGIELGQALFDEKLSLSMLEKYDYDVVIGSVHRVLSGCYDDCYFIDYNKMSDAEININLELYFKDALALVKWDKYDTLAHIAYPYRYILKAGRISAVTPHLRRYDEMAAEIFKMIIENGKAVENNTSGSEFGEEYINLNYRYLSLYHDLGGELITIGSDSHNTQNIGRGIKNAYKKLADIGFNRIAYFEKRRAATAPIN